MMKKNGLRNKEKSLKLTTLGFTLIELLAVIVILSIILLITTISVGSILMDSRESLSNTQKKNIEEAAQTYYLKEADMTIIDSCDETEECIAACVNLSYLISEGYIESTQVIDPQTSEPFEGSVKITYDSNQYYYEYQESLCE